MATRLVPAGTSIPNKESTRSIPPGWTLRINGHFRNLNWRYLPCIRPMVQAYVSEYHHKIWPNIWYSTSILGSWNSHWSDSTGCPSPQKVSSIQSIPSQGSHPKAGFYHRTWSFSPTFPEKKHENTLSMFSGSKGIACFSTITNPAGDAKGVAMIIRSIECFTP